MTIFNINKIKSLALAAVVGVAMTGCDDILFENVNPDVAHRNTCELGLPVLVFYAGQTVYDHAEYNVYLSQCLTTMGKSQTGTYAYKSGWQFLTMNRHPQWRRHFYDIGVNGKEMVDNSREIGSPNFELISRAIQLMSTQLTTDTFGEMPRSEAYQSNSPHYDSQPSIYAWMFEEAEELIKLFEDPEYINNPNNRTIGRELDRVYGGDLNKWKGLVYAVKARLLLRNLPNIDTSSATCQKIIDAAQKAIDCWRSGDLLYGSWFGNEPRYNFDGGVGESSAQWSSAQPIINAWESRANLLSSAVPSKFFVQDCMGVNNPGKETTQGTWERENGLGSDPRLMLLFALQNGPVSASNASNKYMLRFLENNIGAGSTYKQVHYPDLYRGAYAGGTDAYTAIFTMEELYFIQAEAYYWMNNKVKACELAKEATEMNIRRHLERFLMDEGSYPIVDNSGLHGGPAAQEGRFENMLASFLDNVATGNCKPAEEIGNQHWFFSPEKFNLSDLMIQKYIAMYLQPEQWTDMRRYHYSNNRNGYGIGSSKEIVYPKLRRPYNLYQAQWVDGLTDEEKENTWVQRLNPDPETEPKYNKAELERLGAYNNHLWLRKPMIWAHAEGVVRSLTEETEL